MGNDFIQMNKNSILSIGPIISIVFVFLAIISFLVAIFADLKSKGTRTGTYVLGGIFVLIFAISLGITIVALMIKTPQEKGLPERDDSTESSSNGKKQKDKKQKDKKHINKKHSGGSSCNKVKTQLTKNKKSLTHARNVLKHMKNSKKNNKKIKTQQTKVNNLKKKVSQLNTKKKQVCNNPSKEFFTEHLSNNNNTTVLLPPELPSYVDAKSATVAMEPNYHADSFLIEPDPMGPARAVSV